MSSAPDLLRNLIQAMDDSGVTYLWETTELQYQEKMRLKREKAVPRTPLGLSITAARKWLESNKGKKKNIEKSDELLPDEKRAPDEEENRKPDGP